MASSIPTDGFVSVLARLLRHEARSPCSTAGGQHISDSGRAILTFRFFEAMCCGSGSSICDSVFTHSCAPLQVEYQMESTSAVRPELFEFTCVLSARRVSHTKRNRKRPALLVLRFRLSTRTT